MIEPLTLDEAREAAQLVRNLGLVVVGVDRQSRELIVKVPELNVRHMA